MASQRSLNGNYKMQRSLNGDGIMSSVLFADNNLSDVKNKSIARQNLGLIGNVQVGNYLNITNPYDGTSNQTINANATTNSTPNTLVAYDEDGIIYTTSITTSSINSRGEFNALSFYGGDIYQINSIDINFISSANIYTNNFKIDMGSGVLCVKNVSSYVFNSIKVVRLPSTIQYNGKAYIPNWTWNFATNSLRCKYFDAITLLFYAFFDKSVFMGLVPSGCTHLNLHGFIYDISNNVFKDEFNNTISNTTIHNLITNEHLVGNHYDNDPTYSEKYLFQGTSFSAGTYTQNNINFNQNNLTNINTMYCTTIDHPLNDTSLYPYNSGATQTIDFKDNNITCGSITSSGVINTGANSITCGQINTNFIGNPNGNLALSIDANGNSTTFYGDINNANNNIYCNSLHASSLSLSGDLNVGNNNIVCNTVKASNFSGLANGNVSMAFDQYGNFHYMYPTSLFVDDWSGVAQVSLTPNGNISFSGSISGNGSSLTHLNASSITTGTIPSSVIPQLPYQQWRILYTPSNASSNTNLVYNFTLTYTTQANITVYRFAIPFFYNSNDKTARVQFAYNGTASSGTTNTYLSIHAFNTSTMALSSGTTYISRVLCVVVSSGYGYNETLLDLTGLGLTNGFSYILVFSDFNATAATPYKMAFPTFSIGSI